MADIYVVKSQDRLQNLQGVYTQALIPVDEDSIAVLKGIKAGDVYRVTVKKPRNYKFHKKFFALLKVVSDNSDDFTSVEQLLTSIKINLGYTEVIIGPGGAKYQIPKSISFAAMDEMAFNEFYRRAFELVIRSYMPGVSPYDLERAVMEVMEFSP